MSGHRIRRAGALIACAALLALPGAVRAGPAAGTSISNTATATYVDSLSGLNVRLTSNSVSTTVQPLEALSLTASQMVSRSAGSAFTIPHVLTNTGNVTTNYALSLTASGGAFVPTGLALVEDLNGNGVADPGEPVLANGAIVTLAPGAIANLLVTGTVPLTSVIGQSAQLRLTATSQVQAATASNTDTINVVAGPVISVTKSASVAAATPGSSFTYTVNAQNGGSAAAGPIGVTVNGAPSMLFVLRDAIPANTSFVSLGSSTAGAQLIYHRLGDPAGSYLTAAPAAVDSVAWALPDLATAGGLSGTVTVAVHGNAAGTLANTAYADFSAQGANFTNASNLVQLALPALAPQLAFYTSNAYTTTVQQSTLGQPLYLQINAAQCNTDPTMIVTHPVTLVSQRTGDTETFNATETGANTGIFRVVPNVPTADASTHVVASGDGIIEALVNDRVTATLSGCGASAATATVLIDPSGVAFDSRSNAPVAGARVQLIDVSGAGNGGNPGGPARVFAADGVTAAPSTVSSGAGGRYTFPFVPASTYRILITPPNGYYFPSQLPPGLLPAGRAINATGSYGQAFVVAASGPITIDVPLDTAAAGGLFVQKVASKSLAEVGDFVDYLITINNNTGAALAGAVVNDALPAGFAYLKGSARLNGAPLTDPTGGSGPSLVFGLGSIAPGAPLVLGYRVRLGPGAAAGTGINMADVLAGNTRSNEASARVQVSGGVLSDKAYLFGKVYADCNGNRRQDQGEPGIPGVRIYLDNGIYAITDEAGKYSLYGLTPRTHVVKLDTTTLPRGARLEILGNRNGGDAGSQFADLGNGEMHKVDFAVAACTDEINAAIAARLAALRDQPTELTRTALAKVTPGAVPVSDARALPASGLIGVPAAPSLGTATPRASARDAVPVPVAVAGLNAAPAHAFEELLRTLSPEPGFIGLRDGQVLPTTQTAVRVKGPWGAQLRLTVNGQELPAAQVGQKSSLESRGVTAWEYVGVRLEPGENALTLTVSDAFGNVRGSKAIHVTAPGALARIRIVAPPEASADVKAALDIVVELEDARGVPVTSRTAVTLEATLGEWQTPDLDPREPGTQVFVEGGVGHFGLLPPAAPGKARLRASSGTVAVDTEVTFVPNLRPMLATGIVQGVVGLRSTSQKDLLPGQGSNAFEQNIRSMSRSFDGDKGSAAAAGSVFLKGAVAGSSLLTLAYDSDKPADTGLFRDIQPDRFYPVYGDSSVKGYEAQSTGKLYARLDHGTSYALFGDYSTQGDNPARVLTQYSRALNGAKTHLEDGNLTVDGFASYTNTTRVIDEIPANGTSGPYHLSQLSGVLNSQQVEIITRDRNQPSIVLSDQPLTQFTDYAVEPELGQILFKAPVPSLDANLNPIYIRVTYEASTGGPSYWVGGVDLREKVGGNVTLGGMWIHDANAADHQSLGGLNFLWKPDGATTIAGELGRSQSDLIGTGEARRIELRHSDATLQARIYAVQSDPTFNNPNSTYTTGASEYGAKIGYAIDARDRLVIEALKSTTSGALLQPPSSIPLTGPPASIAGGASRDGESIALERSLGRGIKLTAGVRHVDANAVPTQPLAIGAVPNEFTSARLRLDAPVPDVPKAHAFAQYERALDDSTRQATTVGATYQLGAQSRIYVTHETSNSLSGDYGLSATQQNYSTVVGIDTPYMRDGRLFNEYRVADGIDGRSGEAAIGLRNLWHVAPGLGLSTSLQQIHPISGVVTDSATALAGALEYTANPDWKGSTRLEWSRSTTAQSWLGTAGVAAKLDRNDTILARSVYSEQLNTTQRAGGIHLVQYQVGVALRPVTSDVWNALAMIGYKRSANTIPGSALNSDESAIIVSSHLNIQPRADWNLSGRYGVKRATDYGSGLQSRYTTQLLGARSVWDIDRKWDAGIQYYVEFGSNGTNGHQQAVGGEVGYLVMQNLWVSVGYNVTGFRDADLAGEEYTQHAVYLRLRFKFDENLFKPRNNAEPLPASAARMQQ